MDNLCCLACGATYSSRKWLAAHSSQCTLNSTLTNQIFDRQCKSQKRKREEKCRAYRHESPVNSASDLNVPEQPEAPGPNVADDQEELEYIQVDVRIFFL